MVMKLALMESVSPRVQKTNSFQRADVSVSVDSIGLEGDALNVQKAPISTTRKPPVILCVDTMHTTFKEDASVTLGSSS